MSEFHAQGLANTAWACATVHEADEKLFIASARATRRVSEFKPQNLANAAWAFATMNQSDEKLFCGLGESGAAAGEHA